MQAELNRRKKPSFEEAQKKAREEHRKYEEDLKKKAEEAKKFRDYWENKSKWAEHDKAEKDSKSDKSASSGKTDKNGKSGAETGSDAQKNADTEGRGSTDSDETGYGEPSAEAGKQAQTPAEELKSLYRKIVKRLHPDVHPDPTPREKDLLNQAHEAYKIGDLEKMRWIWEEIIGMDPPEDRFEDSEKGRKQLRKLLKALKTRCSLLESEIQRIRSEFPYTMKSFLEDDVAVEERQCELKKRSAMSVRWTGSWRNILKS